MKTPTLIHQKGKTNTLFIAVAAIAIVIGIIVQIKPKPATQTLSFEQLILLPNPKQLGEVNFTSHTGAQFTEQNLKGKWTVLFFAFTHCPDICPNTLQTLKQVKQELVANDTWKAFQLAMISVDPERDTPQRLKQYVPYFDPEFIGLTAGVDYTAEFAKNLGILFHRQPPLEDGNYDVDHSAGLILINPEGNYAGYLGAPHKKDVLVKDLSKLGFNALASNSIKVVNTTTSTPITDSTTTTETATGVESNAYQQTKSAALEVKNAWIRPAPPSAVSMAGYFQLTNTSQDTVSIDSVDSPLFDTTMIHETVIEDGIASMQHMDNLSIEPQQTVTLAPMGIHLMLMRPEQTPSVGTKVPVALTLNNGEVINLNIEVRDAPNQ